MSSFLSNLINRHNPPNAREDISVVEPRPKSRFESNTLTPTEPKECEGNSCASTTVSNGLSETDNGFQQESREQLTIQDEGKQPVSVAESIEIKPADIQNKPISHNANDDFNARLLALSLRLGNKFAFAEPKVDGPISSRPNASESSQGPVNKESRVDSDNFSIGYALDQRVESVIGRLASLNKQPKREQIGNTPQTSTIFTEHTPVIAQQGRAEQPAMIEAESTSKKATLNNESQPEEHAVPQSGLLQQPSWLTELQSGLNKRWQQFNAKPESIQPVVNVTIGRVEVRAVQETKLQAPKMQKKPSGVMSLDDYLKSRDKQGRA